MNEKMKQTTPDRQKKNEPSKLLTRDENEQVFCLLGRKCQTLATAVVQIYVTEPPAHSQWRKKHTAVICFTKDSSKRSYFMRGYCLIRNELVFEHELYDSINVQRTRPYLVTFEGQDGHIAFNFASEDECASYMHMAELTIENRYRKRQERRNRPKTQLAPSAPHPEVNRNKISIDNVDESRVQLRNNPNLNSVQITTNTTTTATPMSKFSFSSSKDKKKTNKKYSKSDIGTPTNFIHVSHVGWDAKKGFDLTGNEEDEVLKSFFNKAGVSEQQLSDRDTRAFIYDFVQSHNVIESVKSERTNDVKPKAPAPVPPPVSKREYNGSSQRAAPPPPPVPTRQPPPPVPMTAPPQPSRGPPPSRPPPINMQPSVPVPVVPSFIPPPPPPPPAIVAPPPPPMPIVNENVPKAKLPEVDDSRNALMDSIRKGINLKKIDPAALSTGSGNSDPRNELLSEIRQGTVLRPVTERELPSGSNRDSTNSGGGTDALADALRRALLDRGRAIHSSDDDSESSDNEDEWED